MSRLTALIVPTCIVDCYAVVPECTSSGRPLESDLNVNVLLVHIIQVVQDQVTLILVKANDTIRHGAVHPERLPARCRVYPNDWVDALNVFGPCIWVLTIQVCVSTSVDSLLAVNDFAEVGTKLFIRGIP